jgi:hypothetical protein
MTCIQHWFNQWIGSFFCRFKWGFATGWGHETIHINFDLYMKKLDKTFIGLLGQLTVQKKVFTSDRVCSLLGLVPFEVSGCNYKRLKTLNNA